VNEEVLLAAQEGNLDQLVRLNGARKNFFGRDLNNRTALHVAACHNHLEVCRYIVTQAQKAAVPIATAKDCFGNTALDDALRENHFEIQKFLKRAEEREIQDECFYKDSVKNNVKWWQAELLNP
jgi:hypothetical protein